MSTPSDVAARIASRSLAERGATYESEVRRLLDAGLTLIGRDSRARVADIVASAGLSNEAFYRHFPSKDAYVAALIEDGALRLRSYLAHQMDKARSPEDKVRRWVQGVLAQAGDEEIASTSRAVLAQASSPALPEHPGPAVLLAGLLEPVLAALGSPQPALDAALASHAVVGHMTEHLIAGTQPSHAETERVIAYVLGPREARRRRRP